MVIRENNKRSFFSAVMLTKKDHHEFRTASTKVLGVSKGEPKGDVSVFGLVCHTLVGHCPFREDRKRVYQALKMGPRDNLLYSKNYSKNLESCRNMVGLHPYF